MAANCRTKAPRFNYPEVQAPGHPIVLEQQRSEGPLWTVWFFHCVAPPHFKNSCHSSVCQPWPGLGASRVTSGLSLEWLVRPRRAAGRSLAPSYPLQATAPASYFHALRFSCTTHVLWANEKDKDKYKTKTMTISLAPSYPLASHYPGLFFPPILLQNTHMLCDIDWQ